MLLDRYWSHITKLPFHVFGKILISYPRCSRIYQADPHDVQAHAFSNNFSNFQDLTISPNRRLGGESNRQKVSCRAVQCVRACGRSGCLVEFDFKRPCPHVPFSLVGAPSFPFSLLGATSFPISLPPTSQTSYPTLVGLIGFNSPFWAINKRWKINNNETSLTDRLIFPHKNICTDLLEWVR